MLRPPLKLIARRAARWRCPNCGCGRLFRGVFRMLPACPECGLSYFPEQGYYVGAMIINYVITTAVVVAIFLLSLLIPDFTTLSVNSKILVWMAFAIVLSLFFLCGTRTASGSELISGSSPETQIPNDLKPRSNPVSKTVSK
jgi:uncharacterized protein (DUF983 family)